MPPLHLVVVVLAQCRAEAHARVLVATVARDDVYRDGFLVVVEFDGPDRVEWDERQDAVLKVGGVLLAQLQGFGAGRGSGSPA